MKPWDSRPREIRNLINPAFCGLLLARGIEGYCDETEKSMPFSLSLLILPLCLHKRTRDQLKAATRSYLIKIIEEHPEFRVDLAQRASNLLPYAMESYALLSSHGAITVDGNGGISTVQGKIKRTISGSQETKDCQSVARILGKKLAQINDRATIYTALGIRP